MTFKIILPILLLMLTTKISAQDKAKTSTLSSAEENYKDSTIYDISDFEKPIFLKDIDSSMSKVVFDYLTMMKNVSDKSKCRKMILPCFFEKNGVDSNDFKLNSYTPKGFKIHSQVANRFTVYIWGQDMSWVHELTFVVCSYVKDHKMYICPNNVSNYTKDKYIDPWIKVKEYIDIDKSILK